MQDKGCPFPNRLATEWDFIPIPLCNQGKSQHVHTTELDTGQGGHGTGYSHVVSVTRAFSMTEKASSSKQTKFSRISWRSHLASRIKSFWINSPTRQLLCNNTTLHYCVAQYLWRTPILSILRCSATIQRTSRLSHFFGVADSRMAEAELRHSHLASLDGAALL